MQNKYHARARAYYIKNHHMRHFQASVYYYTYLFGLTLGLILSRRARITILPLTGGQEKKGSFFFMFMRAWLYMQLLKYCFLVCVNIYIQYCDILYIFCMIYMCIKYRFSNKRTTLKFYAIRILTSYNYVLCCLRCDKHFLSSFSNCYTNLIKIVWIFFLIRSDLCMGHLGSIILFWIKLSFFD